MNRHRMPSIALLALTATCSAAGAQNVKITPLGSHAGELCARDRATIFEDPTGVRILHDAGQSVLGGADARIGRIDVVILSHAHGDHIGDSKLKALEEGTCDNEPVESAAPNSTTAEIAAAKNAAVIMVVPLANFIGRKIDTLRGEPTTACAQTGADFVMPIAAPCLATVQTGGTRTVRASATSCSNATGAVLSCDPGTTVISTAFGRPQEPRAGQPWPRPRAAEWLRHRAVRAERTQRDCGDHYRLNRNAHHDLSSSAGCFPGIMQAAVAITRDPAVGCGCVSRRCRWRSQGR